MFADKTILLSEIAGEGEDSSCSLAVLTVQSSSVLIVMHDYIVQQVTCNQTSSMNATDKYQKESHSIGAHKHKSILNNKKYFKQ